MAKKKLCVVTTHPIQYIAPWFRSLAASPDLDLEVVFFRELKGAQQGVGFGHSFAWDVPLRDGYVSHVLDVPAGWRHVGSLLSSLRARLKSIKPDVVLVTGWNEPALIAASPLIRSMGIPILMRGEANVFTARSGLTRAVHRALLRCSSGALIIGSANRDFYLQNGVSPARLFPGAYFVETERMLQMAQDHAAERESLRRSAGFQPEDFVFTFVGKHVAFKRPRLMIEAASVLRRSGVSVKLMFAGSGELTSELQRAAMQLNVPTHFTGFLNQTELWRAYVPADAFVLPSTNRETWGLVTNEAMLFGLPVVVSNQVGCGPDLVIEGETGYLFDGTAEGLAQSMRRLITAPDEARRMGARARDRVVRQYSMQAASSGLREAVYAVAA